jgi:tripartite-type tricarboxylate transporter receptor subunit TctC
MLRRSILATAVSLLVAPAAMAQSYPDHPITMIVPFAAGGPTDTVARLIAEPMTASLGQQIVVENVGGAGGTLGAGRVAKAEPDGYTLLLHHIGQATSASLYRKLPYKPGEAFEGIGLVTDVPMTIVARTDFPPSSVAELIEYIKTNKDQVTLANAGIGSASHLCGMLLMDALDTPMTTVPYKGTGPAMTDLMGGQVDLMFDNITSSLAPYKSGRIKILGVAAGARIPDLPDVPTLAEAGVKGFQAGSWVGVVAPANTPAPIVAAISQAIAEAVKTADVQKKFSDIAAQPVGNTPAEMAAYLAAESAKWRRVIRSANVTVD